MRKEIADFPGYAVDTDGNVWSRKSKNGKGEMLNYYRKLTLHPNTGGYLQVILCKDNKKFPKRVHRLVLKTFVGKCPPNQEGCHNNGQKNKNNIKNLRWDFPQNNYKDRLKHGTCLVGIKHHKAKLNELQVRIIKKYLDDRQGVNVFLAEIFNINMTAISKIRNNKTWKHI